MGGGDKRAFGGDVAGDRVVELEGFAEHAEGVFAHLFAGEKLRWGRGEIEAELHGFGGEGEAEVGRFQATSTSDICLVSTGYPSTKDASFNRLISCSRTALLVVS